MIRPLRLLVAAIATAAASLTATTVFSQTPAPEVRALWVSRFEWPSSNPATAQANIVNIMTQAHANNFNTILFQVRGQCDVHYPSPYEPWTSTYNWTNPGWDPLQFAIDQAHARGMELHAYINTHVMTSPIPPANTTPIHPYHLHGVNVPAAQSWLIRDVNGNIPSTGDTDGYTWISPGIPEASAWTRRMVLDIVQRYDVDGVHFDRIRSPGANYTYDPVTRTRFNNGAVGQANPDGLGISDFMRSQITRDLRNIYAEIQYYKPHVKTSAAPFGIVYKDATTHYQGTGTQSYHTWFQDSWGWMQAHVLDFMVPQIYWQVGSAHPFELLLQDWMERSGGRFVVAGSTTSDGNKTPSALLAEHAQTRLQGAAGHCVFSYSTMGNYWSSFKDGSGTKPYDQPTTTPVMPWKATPTVGTICGTVVDILGNPVLDAQVKMQGDTYNYLSAHDGFFGILDVAPGTQLQVSASFPGRGNASQVLSVAAGGTTSVTLQLLNSNGALTLDRANYRPGDAVKITVTDHDLAGDGTVAVNATSPTEFAGEAVTLIETSPGTFTGTLILTSAVATGGDSLLSVTHADQILVLYVDANNGTGGSENETATALVDAQPPLIAGVTLLDEAYTSATVVFTTDELAAPTIWYGASCDALTSSTTGTTGTVHAVTLTGLAPGATYYLSISVFDAAGNSATDNNGAACYMIETLPIPIGLYADFEDGPGEWTATGLWHWNQVGGIDPCASAHSGTSAWYYGNSSCSYSTGSSRNFGSLISPQFLVPEGARLMLWSREQTENISTYDTRRIYIVPQGSPRTLVYASSNNSNSYYSPAPVNLAAFEGQVVSVEFEFDTQDGVANAFRGWYVDDVVVDSMEMLPSVNMFASGGPGGPFGPCSAITLNNFSSASAQFTLSDSEGLVTFSPATGTIPGGGSTQVSACVDNGAAAPLLLGRHISNVSVAKVSNPLVHTRKFVIDVVPPPDKVVPIAPGNGSTAVDANSDLSWNASAGNAMTYDVYFGTTNPPPFLENVSNPAYALPPLEFSTTYYWRIDARQGFAVTPSDVWSFTTVSPPVLDVDPDQIETTVELGQPGDSPLNILNLATAGGGDLLATIDTPRTTEQIGVANDSSVSGTSRYRGQVYFVTKSLYLKKIEQHLAFTGAADLNFVVFRAATLGSTFQRIATQTVNRVGTGDGFYSSDDLNIELEANFCYIIAVGWGANTIVYPFRNDTGNFPRQTGIGLQLGGFGVNSYPIGTSITYSNSINSYPQRLTTSEPWIAVDPNSVTVAPGSGEQVDVKFAGDKLAVGTYETTLTVSSNDPATLQVEVPVKLNVVDTTPPATPDVPDLYDDFDSGVSNSDNITKSNTPVFFGLAEGNTTVTLFLDGNVVERLYIPENGANWSIGVFPPLADGTYTLTAAATDASGNESAPSAGLTVTIDTVAPAPPSVPDLVEDSDTGSSQEDNVTGDTTPTFAGTAEANSQVFITNGLLQEGAFAFGGIYEVGFSNGLPNGTHFIQAHAFDLAGNESPLSNALQITIDSEPPSYTIDLLPGSDSGQHNWDNVTKVVRPSFAITTVANATVDLMVNGNAVASGTTDGEGVITLTPENDLSPGDLIVYARVQDEHGNASTDEGSIIVRIDTSAPGVTVVPISPDPRVTPVDSVPVQFTESVYGLTLAHVQLSRNEQSITLITASVQGGPQDYLVTLNPISTLPNGSYRFSILPTGIADIAGNALLAGAHDEWVMGSDADVELSIETSVTSTTVGSMVSFTYVITNHGNNESDVLLRASFDPAPEIVSWEFEPGEETAYIPGLGGWSFNDVPSDGVVSATVTLRPLRGPRQNTSASIMVAVGDPNLSNNTATASILVPTNRPPGAGIVRYIRCHRARGGGQSCQVALALLVSSPATRNTVPGIRIYYSPDDLFNSNDVLVKSLKVPRLASADLYRWNTGVRLPRAAREGYLLFIIDKNYKVPEQPTNDNFFIVPLI